MFNVVSFSKEYDIKNKDHIFTAHLKLYVKKLPTPGLRFTCISGWCFSFLRIVNIWMSMGRLLMSSLKIIFGIEFYFRKCITKHLFMH